MDLSAKWKELDAQRKDIDAKLRALRPADRNGPNRPPLSARGCSVAYRSGGKGFAPASSNAWRTTEVAMRGGGPRSGPAYSSRGARDDAGRPNSGRDNGYYGPGQDNRQQRGSGGVGSGFYSSTEKKRRLDEPTTAHNGAEELQEAGAHSMKRSKSGEASETHEDGNNNTNDEAANEDEEDMEGVAKSLEPEDSAAVVAPGTATAESTNVEAKLVEAAAAAAAAATVDVAAAPPVLAPPTKRDRRMFGALMGHLAAGKKDGERSAARLEARKQVHACFFHTCRFLCSEGDLPSDLPT